MARGRPPLGPELVERLEGPDVAKARLKVILETISGERTIPDACAKLGIGESAFHELRHRALGGAVEALVPGAPGRPPAKPSPESGRVEELQAELERLRVELQAARLREELAVAMPHLVRPLPEESEKKGGRAGRGRRRRRRQKRRAPP